MDSKHKIVAGIAASLVLLLFCFWIPGLVSQLLAPRYIYIEHPSPPYDISRDTELEYLYRIPYPIVTKSENPVNISAENIAIVIVLSEGKERDYYRISLDSVECYAKAHGYQFILTNDSNWGCDHLKEKYFRRHCVIAKILPRYDAIMHLDADIGVVNPKKRIEDFLDEKIDITFYDRHFNQEIAIGSYIARNTPYALEIINDFGEYETRLPVGSFHGTENGALHIFLAEKLFPDSSIELELCRMSWKNSRTIIDQFTYTSCVRAIMGAATDFGRLRILRKGTTHIRDNWLTGGVWSPERDFMFHGYKMHQLTEVPDEPIFPVPMSYTHWYNPFLGNFDLTRCVLGNTTWNHNPKFIGTREAVEYELRKYEVNKAMQKMKLFESLHNLINNGTDRKSKQPALKTLFPY